MQEHPLVSLRKAHHPPTGDASLCAIKRFGKYKGDTEKAVRTVTMKESEGLRNLESAWKAFKFDTAARCESSEDVLYEDILYHLIEDFIQNRNMIIASRDVTEFSIIISKFSKENDFTTKAGIFLSVAAKLCEGEEVVLDVQGLSRPLDCLGYRNAGKTIRITGDAGDYLGSCMDGGAIYVSGDAGTGIGECGEGGEIHISGGIKDIDDYISSDTKVFVKGKHVFGPEDD